MKFSLSYPLRLPSVANMRMHHMAKAKLVAKQREATQLALKVNGAPNAVPRLHITITRVAPRALDDDNNVSAGKAVRDEIAAWFGLDDRDARIKWAYAQEKGPVGVRIDIERVETLHVRESVLADTTTAYWPPAEGLWWPKTEKRRSASARPIAARDLALKATPNIKRNR